MRPPCTSASVPSRSRSTGSNDHPVKTYEQFAYNLGQTVLRSESESHFLPADWPTFAELESWSRRSLAPLVRSARRRYNPGLPDIMAEARIVARRLGWDDQRYPAKVGWLQRGEHERRRAAFRPLRRGGPLHRPREARHARLRPRAALVPAGAREGAAGSGDGRPNRPGLRAEGVRPHRPLHRDRLGDRVGQRVGERDRRRCEVHLARPQSDAGRAGPEHAALLLRGVRHRRLPGARLRPAHRVSRPHPQGNLSDTARLGLEDRAGPRGGPLRAADR